MAAIKFDITADNSGFVSSVQDIQKRVRETSSVLKGLGKNFNIDGVVNQIVSLTKVIQDQEALILKSKGRIADWLDEAMKLRNAGDMNGFEAIQKDIEDEAKSLTALISETKQYKDALNEIKSMSGMGGGGKANMFFGTQQEFEAYEELLRKREEIESRIANFDSDGMSDRQATARLVEMRSELTVLNAQISKSEEAAASAAAALGKNGEEASRAAERYYRLNQAVESQVALINDLQLKMNAAKDKLVKAVNAGDVDGARDAQVEYDTLAESVHNAKMELTSLKGEQQEAEGNFRNFGNATESLRTQLRNITMELSSLTLQYRQMNDEEQKSVEGRALAEKIKDLTEKAGELRDVMNDVNQAVGASASDTSAFDAMAGGINVLTSSIGAATGVAAMFGVEEKDLLDIQAKLQASLAISNALTVIQTNLQKESALMLGIAALQKKALTAAENLDTAAKGKNIIATTAATVAQKAFNLVAKANPYVLLATAIITVVGALAAFSIGTRKAREEEEKLNEARKRSAEAFADTYANSISTVMAKYKQLQTQYQLLKTEHEKTEWIRKNKNEMDSLGVSVNNVADAESLFKKNTQDVVRAFTMRAKAAAYAAQMADLYKNAMTYKAGDEVDESTYKGNGLGTGNFATVKGGFFTDSYYLTQEGADYMNRLAMDQVDKQATTLAEKQAELEKQAETLLGGLSKSFTETEKKYSDNAADRRQKEADEQAKWDEQMTSQHLAALQARAKADIAQIQNDAERERKEAELSHQQRIQQIRKQADEYRKALYEHNRAVWENQNKDKNKTYADTEEGAAGWANLELTKDQMAEIEALLDEENAKYARIVRERMKDEAQAMRDYLKSYGSFEQQKLAIAQEYEQKIKDASSEGERLRLAREQKQAEANLSFENISMGIDWKALFSGVSNLSSAMMKPMYDKLTAYTETDEYRNASADTQQKIAELIQELRGYLGSNHDVTWQTLETAMKDFTSSVDRYNAAVQAEKDAVARRDEAKRKLDAGEITQEAYDELARQADELGNQTAKAKEEMSGFADTLSHTTDEVENFTSQMTVFFNNLKGLENLEGGGELIIATESLDKLKGDLDATIAGMKDGTAKEIADAVSSAIGTGMNFIGNGLTSILGEGIGSMITLFAQLPKLILQIVGAIKNIITGILDALSELISLRWIDDLVNSILDAIGNLIDVILDLPENIAKVIGSILEGVGGLVEGVVGRVANIITFGALDSGFISDWLFGDNSAFEEAVDKWGWLLDSWEDNLEYEKSLMEKAYGSDAIGVQQYSEEMLRNTMQAAREVYEGWAGSGAGLFSHSNGYDANSDARWDYLIKSNPEIAKKIGIYEINTPWFSFYEGEDISKLFGLDWQELERLKYENSQFWQSLYEEARNYLDQYIEAGKAIEEMNDALNEKLTTTTKENVFDDFLNSLYQLAEGSEDVFDDIADAWRQMVNKMVINSFVAKDFQEKLEQWYEKLAYLQKRRSDGQVSDEYYSQMLAAYKSEYDGYVKDAQNRIEEFRKMGVIQSAQENDEKYSQEASKKGFAAMSQDTGEELNGRFTALQISGENISEQAIAAVMFLTTISTTTATMAGDVAEIRNLVFTSTGYLEDMAKYSKNMYIQFGEKIDRLVEQTRNM